MDLYALLLLLLLLPLPERAPPQAAAAPAARRPCKTLGAGASSAPTRTPTHPPTHPPTTHLTLESLEVMSSFPGSAGRKVSPVIFLPRECCPRLFFTSAVSL